MVNFDGWLADNSPADESFYAVRAWNLIQRKPVSLVVKRGTTLKTAQTVRVEYSNAERELKSASGAIVTYRDVVVFGVKNHPDDGVADTDLKRGDIFALNGREFRITDIVTVLGGIQAFTEASS